MLRSSRARTRGAGRGSGRGSPPGTCSARWPGPPSSLPRRARQRPVLGGRGPPDLAQEEVLEVPAQRNDRQEPRPARGGDGAQEPVERLATPPAPKGPAPP